MDVERSLISILAGNSRVFIDEAGEIVVEAQLKAFESALKFASQCTPEQGNKPRISVAFGHHGIFRKHFLAEKLTNSQKRRPRLCHLHQRIQRVFLPVANQYNIPLSEIYAIHEDSARQHLVYMLENDDIPEPVVNRMRAPAPASAGPQASKLSCAAITREYFERAAGEGRTPESVLEVFFEDSPWSGSLAWVRGLQLSHLLGFTAGIRLNLVDEQGGVQQGEIIAARQNPQF